MALPVATVSLPYFPGLTEIGRNYFPKVHVFYRDIEAERYLRSNQIEYTDDDIYRLKFAGVVHRYSYSMQKTSGGASKQFTIHCSHKYYVLNEIVTLFGARQPEDVTNPTADGAVAKVASYFGSAQMSLDCMKPVKPPVSVLQKYSASNAISGPPLSPDSLLEDPTLEPADIDITILPEGMVGYENRVQGIPGYITNIWGALKRDSYSSQVSVEGKDNLMISRPMVDVYIPLLDNGLKFFRRMSGHPVIESDLNIGVPTAGANAVDKSKLSTESKIVVPPIMHASVGAAASVDLSLLVMETYLSYTGQTGSLMEIFQNTLNNIRYDMCFLASPAQATTLKEGVDVLVKPVMSTYFSPTCNVILPTMYDSLSIEESYYDTPTRVSAVDNVPLATPDGSFSPLQFRAPHLYRTAVAGLKKGVTDHKTVTGNLLDSLSFVYEAVGSHELGQGIRYKFVEVEPWVRFLFVEEDPEKLDKYLNEGKYEEGVEEALHLSWLQAHAANDTIGTRDALEKLNPWSPKEGALGNGLDGAYRNLLATLEYDYSVSLVQARVGRVSGVFNPHVIPGYPCDVISKNANEPSYHAFVTSVDTSYSSSGFCGTTVTFSSAFTYDEFGSYYLPSTQPWLSAQLDLASSYTMLDPTSKARKTASDYYKQVIGVGAAFPTALYDFAEGRGLLPVISDKGDIDQGVPWPYGLTGEYLTIQETSDKALSTEASLAMTRREIETLGDVAESMGVKFISLPRGPDGLQITASSQTSAVKSALKGRAAGGKPKHHDVIKSVGKSVFLDYPDEKN
jgi:hypothetical protein